jgi:hypothetical protein
MDEFGAASPFADITQSGVDYSSANKGVTPVFYIEPVPDEKATEAAGAVRMREQEMIRIHVAGDMLNVHASPVLPEHKERFAVQYEAWKTKRVGRHIDGTPLKNWPMIPALRIAEFEAMGIFSVENLSDVSDINIVKLADGRIWREKAKAWLDNAKDSGASVKLAAENERMKADIDDLRKQIAELGGKEQKRKPGRPRKPENAVHEITESL